MQIVLVSYTSRLKKNNHSIRNKYFCGTNYSNSDINCLALGGLCQRNPHSSAVHVCGYLDWLIRVFLYSPDSVLD
jgi:hypothetical protein